MSTQHRLHPKPYETHFCCSKQWVSYSLFPSQECLIKFACVLKNVPLASSSSFCHQVHLKGSHFCHLVCPQGWPKPYRCTRWQNMPQGPKGVPCPKRSQVLNRAHHHFGRGFDQGLFQRVVCFPHFNLWIPMASVFSPSIHITSETNCTKSGISGWMAALSYLAKKPSGKSA